MVPTNRQAHLENKLMQFETQKKWNDLKQWMYSINPGNVPG